MKISLNRANKLRAEIEALTFSYNTSITTMSTSDLDAVENVAIDTLKDVVKNIEVKCQSSWAVRSLIDGANDREGVTEIIGEIAYLERYLSSINGMHQNIVAQSSRQRTKQEVKAVIDHGIQVASVDITKSPVPSMITFRYPESIVERFSQEIKEIKLRIKTLQEERNKLNHTSYIELPKSVVEFAQANGLL